MRRSPRIFRINFTQVAIGVILFFSLCNTDFIHAQSQTGDEAKITEVVNQLYDAMVQKDKMLLLDLTMKKLTYGHSSGNIENQSEFIDGVMNGAFQFSSITPVDQSVTISGKVSVVRHIFNGEGINNGVAAKVNIGCLLVFQRKGKNWKLLARQAYKL